MIDAKFKEPWVSALRSGDYEQTQGCLRNSDDKMCCLGVLGTVIVDNNLIEGAIWTEVGRGDATFHVPVPADAEYSHPVEATDSSVEVPYAVQQTIPGWEYGDSGRIENCTWVDLYELFPKEIENWLADKSITVLTMSENIERYGWADTIRLIRESCGVPTLVRLNDEVGLNFEQIAQVVEKWM